MEKIKVHIDPKGYTAKPPSSEIAGIKNRLQKGTSPSLVTVEELVAKIEEGHSISPGIMNGMSAKDWQEQQIFLVDIDNNEDGEMLRPKDALKICQKYDLELAFYYQTFNHSKEKPKFRLAFIMEKPITNDSMRKQIVETLVTVFPQSDKSCVNADRIFHGTNKKVFLRSENARVSWESIEKVSLPTSPRTLHLDLSSHTSGRMDSELDRMVQDFDLFSYLKERNGDFRTSGGSIVFQACEICGHHDNLMYVPKTNSFSCLSKNVGGSIIDYLIHAEGLSRSEAIYKLKNELNEPEWISPLPFDDVKLPPFPVNALPEPLREWVAAVAANTETPVDMAAVCALAVLSCSVQGKYIIAIKNSYVEPLNLYFLMIANSGERKSAIVRIMTKPIFQYEQAENERRRSKIDSDQTELNLLKKQIEDMERSGNSVDLEELRCRYRDLERNQTKLLRMIVDDATPEAITSMLARNSGILSLITTEGGIFETLAGRYSNTLSIDTILKAYSGDPIRVDRKGREGEIINNPSLTMLLAAQDNVLIEMMKNEAFKSRGLTARILYSRPKSKMGHRSFDTPDVDPDLEVVYGRLIMSLLQIPYPQTPQLPCIQLSNDAKEEVAKFHDWIEPRLGNGQDNMEGWGGKLVGNMSRIAGILHCAKHPENSNSIPVSSKTVRQAIKIAKYFLRHAQCVYNSLDTDKDIQLAKKVIQKLEHQEKRELTKYQIYRLCRTDFRKVEDAVPIIDILVEHSYLREKKYPNPTGGRPRASGYLLNPIHFGKD